MARSARGVINLARGVKLPTDAITQTFGIMARRGAGKTYTAQKLAEGMLDARGQIVVLDPIGNWWSLRLAADGKTAAYDVPVFGGLHGDLPLRPQAGELVADVIAENGTAAVLDVSQFRKSERKRFVTDFCERLFMRRKRDPAPTHIFLEEAQAFIPQRVGKDETRMVGAVEDIVRMGRNYGLGATMISQRPQSVNKEVLNQAECLILLQINGAHERKAIQDWVAYHGIDVAEMVRELPSLEIGEAFIWSPQWLDLFKRVKITKKSTFDASATPKAGKRPKKTKLKALDMKAIETAMESIVEEQKANDPKELRREIARLKKEAEGTTDKREILHLRALVTELERRPTMSKVDQRKLASIATKVRLLADVKVSQIADECSFIAAEIERFVPTDDPRPTTPRREPRPAPRAAVRPRKPGGKAWRILEAIIQHPDGIHPDKARRLAKVSPTSSTMSVALSKHRQDGLIERHDGLLFPTEAAIAEYGDAVEPLPTGEELRAYWLAFLSGASRRILQALYDAWPGPMTKEDVCAAADVSTTSSTLSVAMSDLRRLDLAEKGAYKAQDHLFE